MTRTDILATGFRAPNGVCVNPDGTFFLTAATVSADGKTVTLEIEDIKPTWSMEIKYNFKASDGSPVIGFLHKTIHRLGE